MSSSRFHKLRAHYMFTGIIEELGRIKSITKKGKVTLLTLEADKVLDDTKIGDSLAVNGVCLTVVEKDTSSLSFEIISQTFSITNLGSLKSYDKVNLERSLKLGDRLSGHFVTGHIDCIGFIRRKRYISDNLCFEIAIPAKFIDYVIPKGSIAIDGVSLTIVDKRSSTFSVYIIPHTLKNTTFGFKGPSDKINVEFDILAKRA